MQNRYGIRRNYLQSVDILQYIILLPLNALSASGIDLLIEKLLTFLLNIIRIKVGIL